MTDIELLPLPEPSDKLYKPETLTSHGYVTYRHTTQQVKAYARAVAEHNVKALQEELDNRWATGVHTCHDNCQRIACVQRREIEALWAEVESERAARVSAQAGYTQQKARAERLAEALRECISLGHPRDPAIIAARAALPGHDQEEGR